MLRILNETFEHPKHMLQMIGKKIFKLFAEFFVDLNLKRFHKCIKGKSAFLSISLQLYLLQIMKDQRNLYAVSSVRKGLGRHIMLRDMREYILERNRIVVNYAGNVSILTAT